MDALQKIKKQQKISKENSTNDKTNKERVKYNIKHTDSGIMEKHPSDIFTDSFILETIQRDLFDNFTIIDKEKEYIISKKEEIYKCLCIFNEMSLDDVLEIIKNKESLENKKIITVDIIQVNFNTNNIYIYNHEILV